MAFKMNNPYGKGSHDTSSKHGTNVNYQKSGMKDHLGNAVDANGAPFLGKLVKGAGKLFKGAAKFGAFGPLGTVASHLMDKNKAKQGGAADANAAAGIAGAAQPAAAPAPAAPGAAPVDATQMEEPGVQGAQMKKSLKTGAPKRTDKKDLDEILDPVERKTQKEIKRKQDSSTAYNEEEIRARNKKKQDARFAEIKKIQASKKFKEKEKKILDARMKKHGTTDMGKIHKKAGAPGVKDVIKKGKKVVKKAVKNIKKSRAYKGAKEVGEGFKMIGHTITHPVQSIKSDIKDYKRRKAAYKKNK